MKHFGVPPMFPIHTRILVVEDIRSMLEVTVETLNEMGYKDIVTAEDGEIALQTFEDASKFHPIDVIISDWNMPNMNGIELLEEIRKLPEGEKIPFLLLTTESEKAKVVEAIVLGVSNYMVKPISYATLDAKLREIYKRHID
jgi:two-component system chemotaxis response regulator CheY